MRFVHFLADTSSGGGCIPAIDMTNWAALRRELTGRFTGPSKSELKRQLADQKIQNRELSKAAYQDELTGLLNRRGFKEKFEAAIAHARAKGESFGLIFIDLDGFKQTNDIHGHEAGDKVLQVVADVLRSTARQENRLEATEQPRDADILSRHGGDEMLIMIKNPHDKIFLRDIAERIREKVEAAFGAAGLNYGVTTSMGAVLFRSNEKMSADAMIAAADQAAYFSKTLGGKNCVCLRKSEHADAQAAFANDNLTCSPPRPLSVAVLRSVARKTLPA